MTAGEKIEKLAKTKGYSVRQLAISAGVNYSTLYSIIKRRSSFINTDMLMKIAKVLDVAPEVLTDDSADVQTRKFTEAEILVINTIQSMVGTNFGKDRENYLYLINSFLEANQNLIESLFKSINKKGE